MSARHYGALVDERKGERKRESPDGVASSGHPTVLVAPPRIYWARGDGNFLTLSFPGPSDLTVVNKNMIGQG